jgi:DNA repair protein RadA/Sms
MAKAPATKTGRRWQMKLNVAREELSFGTNILELQVPDALRKRVKSGIDFVDAALGGEGFTPSQALLFTGTPGAGKTTLMLKLADSLTKQGAVVVFNTAEESLYQVKLVVERLGLKQGFAVGQETHVPTLLQKCEQLRAAHPGKPFFLIIDSLQTLDDGKYAEGFTNSKTAERALSLVTDWCKAHYTNAVVIGQVTKSGGFAGNNRLLHLVDGMFEMKIEEKDPDLAGCRVLSTRKNRFGGAGMQVWLDLKRTGFTEVARLGVK